MNGCSAIHYLNRDPVEFVDKFSVWNSLSPHMRGLACFQLMAKICGLRLQVHKCCLHHLKSN